jgi:hypothetical protein
VVRNDYCVCLADNVSCQDVISQLGACRRVDRVVDLPLEHDLAPLEGQHLDFVLRLALCGTLRGEFVA